MNHIDFLTHFLHFGKHGGKCMLHISDIRNKGGNLALFLMHTVFLKRFKQFDNLRIVF